MFQNSRTDSSSEHGVLLKPCRRPWVSWLSLPFRWLPEWFLVWFCAAPASCPSKALAVGKLLAGGSTSSWTYHVEPDLQPADTLRGPRAAEGFHLGCLGSWLWQSSDENSEVLPGSATAKELAENSLMGSSKYNQEKVRASEKRLDCDPGWTDSHSHQLAFKGSQASRQAGGVPGCEGKLAFIPKNLIVKVEHYLT